MTSDHTRVKQDRWFWAAVALGALLFVTAAAMALLRFHTLGNTNSDIAFYTRVVWGLANGDRVNSILGAHDLGLHLMPAMWLFAPLAHILPIPDTLLVVQAAALGAATPLVFRMTTRITQNPKVGLALSAAWVLFPSTLQIGCREFHPCSLALPVLLAALDALHAERHRLALGLLAAACLAREDVSLLAAGTGAALLFEPGRRRLGAVITSGGLAWFLVYGLAVQPALLPENGSFEAHFEGLGHSTLEVGLYLLSRPVNLLGRVFTGEKTLYVAVLLLGLGGVPLLGARWLLPSLLPLCINLISDFPAAVSVRSHYVTLLLPGLFTAAAVGLARVIAWKPAAHRVVRFAVGALLLGATGAHLVYGASPLSTSWSAEPYRMSRNDGILAWYVRTIKQHPELSVTAPAAALNHLAERRHAYSFAFDHPKPDVAILDIRFRQWAGLSPERWNTRLERSIQRVDADPAYGLWRCNPPYRVMWRGLPGGAERLAAVSPGRLPDTAVPQQSGWPGVINLVGLEARLSYEREDYTGEYRKHLAVRSTFYWRAQRPLPKGLLIKMVLKGDTKTHTRYLLPTWGVRDTGTWRPGELIRDEQWVTSPGGWPLSALSATVQFVNRDEAPFPSESTPVHLRW